eukprot:3938967-Rhodomonas_salina.1
MKLSVGLESIKTCRVLVCPEGSRVVRGQPNNFASLGRGPSALVQVPSRTGRTRTDEQCENSSRQRREGAKTGSEGLPGSQHIRSRHYHGQGPVSREMTY